MKDCVMYIIFALRSSKLSRSHRAKGSLLASRYNFPYPMDDAFENR